MSRSKVEHSEIEPAAPTRYLGDGLYADHVETKRPCPHCKCTSVTLEQINSTADHPFYRCTNCGADGPMENGIYWDTRLIEDELLAALEDATDMLHARPNQGEFKPYWAELITQLRGQS